ncbi:MAG: DUF1272 domain-containing protein [Candidatus Marinimicrobia bacterium]|nr:DUF1272 domain-containing protein [Candidatus Neomarinimicrobiota bacterium]
MTLGMRTECEKCHKHLSEDSDACICTHECTFCADCSREMEHVCPNCSGELVKRPRRFETA